MEQHRGIGARRGDNKHLDGGCAPTYSVRTEQVHRLPSPSSSGMLIAMLGGRVCAGGLRVGA
jgi:hypothetical protein